MEAEVLGDGVRLAVDMSLQHVVVKTDALEVRQPLERSWR
jgi:hypothetical protein